MGGVECNRKTDFFSSLPKYLAVGGLGDVAHSLRNRSAQRLTARPKKPDILPEILPCPRLVRYNGRRKMGPRPAAWSERRACPEANLAGDVDMRTMRRLLISLMSVLILTAAG